ncbi:MAG: aldo/keto reductase [Planctomycetota bacterium]|nr:MAG: aldo/keto reductase [Planctomycetota bacterium]
MRRMPELSRRHLLGGAALLAALPRRLQDATLPLRPLGSTGRSLPILGLGCYPLGALDSEEDALAVVRRACETGARYFDTAPSYSAGRSERRVGKALAGLPRDQLYVATKTLERDGDAALAELEQSLERLGMDYVDCLQVHEVRSADEPLEDVFRALQSAQAKKKVRSIGVTGHRDPRFVLAALERHPFASALVPINPLDCHHLSFTRDFAPKAREKGVAVIAMKVYAGGALPAHKPDLAATDLIRFALAQDGVCVAVPGADSIARWDEARAAAVTPAPSAEDQEKLIAAAGPHRKKSSEWYKNES